MNICKPQSETFCEKHDYYLKTIIFMLIVNTQLYVIAFSNCQLQKVLKDLLKVIYCALNSVVICNHCSHCTDSVHLELTANVDKISRADLPPLQKQPCFVSSLGAAIDCLWKVHYQCCGAVQLGCAVYMNVGNVTRVWVLLSQQ